MDPRQIAGVILAVAVVIGVRFWVNNSSEKRKKCYKPQGPVKVTQINVYPIKSCKGIQLDRWPVDNMGFKYDRRWMVVDKETNRFVTARQYPKMCLITPSFVDDYLQITAPSMPTIKIPLNEKEGTKGQEHLVTIWDAPECKAYDQGDEAAKWFEQIIGKEVRLVRLPEDSDRTVPPTSMFKDGTNKVGFADAFPFLLISEESLEDLNNHIQSKRIPMKRFRPNIVVKAENGGSGYMEDTWSRIDINGIGFHVAKMCTRCKLTTVDPDKGEFDGEEPLNTLRTYRKGLLNGKDEVVFGQNLVHTNAGEIRVGDAISIVQ